MTFYAYQPDKKEHTFDTDFPNEPFGTQYQRIIHLKTVRGAINRCRHDKYLNTHFRLYRFTDFYDRDTFTFIGEYHL